MTNSKLGISILLLFLCTVISKGQHVLLERKINFIADNITIDEALKSLSIQENISFSYVSALPGLTKKINLTYSNATLKSVLVGLFAGTNIIFEEVNEMIVLKTRKQPKTHSIRGTIEDMASGEQLISANIYDSETKKGTTSNYYGFYSLTLPEGRVKLSFSYVGYTPLVIEINLTSDTVINPRLIQSIELKEIIIKSDKINIVESNQMGKIEMSAMKTKALPVFLGEADIMKTIQLLPGIKGGTEASSGLYVRGGGPDQNLILLDGVPVYNASHLFGFFSVFNSDAIQNFTVLKGGFPSRYGGRLSSVIDIKMKEGNNKKIQGEASVGLIASKFTVEGPVANENTSFIISGRRTYLDALINLYNKLDGNDETFGYYFYDLNGKINHKFSDRSRLYYSMYNGSDKFYYYRNYSGKDVVGGLGWWNLTNALRWNYVINDNLFSNLTLTYSKYKFNVLLEHDTIGFNYNSGIYDWGAKLDFDFIPSPEHYIRYGANYCYHTFNPGVEMYKNFFYTPTNRSDMTVGNKQIYAHDYFFYAEDDYKISERLKINAGIHFSGFNVKGKNYYSLQPRLMSRYLLTKMLSVKASAIKMTQYIHLLTNSNYGLPTDLWIPSTKIIKPQQSWQYALGISCNLKDKYDISLEGYYKPMFNLIEYKEGATYLSNDNTWENKIEPGKGWAKGVELLLNKTSGKITGWIGYTLAFTDRQFENISFGQKFPYKYDRRHDVSIALIYKPKDNFDIGVTWVYGTGLAATLPEKRYLTFNGHAGSLDDSKIIEYITKRNSYRMPSYHRLDIGLNFHRNFTWGSRTLSFGIYNVYNRKNPFFLTPKYRKDGTKMIAQQSLFPIIPSINYSIKF